MSDQAVLLILAIAATFFAAGLVKGATGMGLPTVAMGVLGALISPTAAAALLLVPSFVTNVWQLFRGPRFGTLIRRLWSMMTTLVIGTVAGSSLLATGGGALTTRGLGVALIGYSTYALFAKPMRIPARWEYWLSPLIGLATGLITGATGMFTVPAVPYIQSLELDPDDLVQALGLSFTVSTAALAVGLIGRGAVPIADMVTSTFAVIPALLGIVAGQGLRARISPQVFRRLFLVFLMVLGLQMALQGLV